MFIALICCQLSALSIDEWQNLRFSEKTADAKVYLRTDIGQTGINLNKVIHNAGSGNTELDLSLQNATNNTYQSYINAGSSRTYYGLRKQVGTQPMQVVPLRYTGTTLPAPNLLTKVSDDPANDQATNYRDIVADYVTVSDNKLIVGLQNRGGGFTYGSFIGGFNSYMCIVGDPILDDPNTPGAVVWALQYVNVAVASMTPGLYKITGTGISDVTRIGDISFSINATTNTLVMSCDMSVLLSDPDFMAFYDPANPKFGFVSLINKIIAYTLTVTQEDTSTGGVIHPIPLYVDPDTSPFGQISALSLQVEENDLYFSAQYLKPADRFEWGQSFITEAGTIYPMTTTDPEYAMQRSYRSANLLNTFPECDGQRGRIGVERIPGVYQQSDWYAYSFVRGLNDPANLQMVVQGEQLMLSWDAVNQTPSGNPVQADYYEVEYAALPDQGFEFLLQATQNSVSIPLSSLGTKAFLRVTAHKNVP